MYYIDAFFKIEKAPTVVKMEDYTSLGSEVCERFDTGDVGVKGDEMA